MKLFLLLTALCLPFGGQVHAQTTDRREVALRTLINTQQQAWERGDGAAWASVFSDDASFVNVRGDAFQGRDTITKQHVFIFAGPFKGSKQSVKVESITYPAPTVAVVQATYDVTQYAFLPPGITATEPGVLRTRMMYIAVQHGGSWQMVAAHNTAVLPAPPQGRFAPAGLGAPKP